MNNPFIHVILMSVYPVIWLYSANLHQALFTDTIIPVIILTSLSLIILTVLNKLTKNLNFSALSVSTLVLIIFAFGPLNKLLKLDNILSSLLILILCLIIYFYKKNSSKLMEISRKFNLLAIFLLIFPLYSIIQNAKLDKSLTAENKINFKIWENIPRDNTQFPDIYYIILDRYAADKSLKEEFEYDNSGFTGYLKSKGFFVCQNCWANYYSSAHSIASSLNMVYLDDLISPQHQTDRDWKKIYGLIKNHQVGKILKLIGYKYYHLGSWWWPTSKNKMADHNINLGLFSEFSSNLFSNTVFYPFVRKFNLPIFDGRYAQWRRINYQMGKLADIPDISSATFVFAHFIIPHEPYIFEANGNYLTSDKEAKRSAREKYTEQIIFLNSRLHSLIDGILLKEKNSVIILQADEGPYPSAFENNKNQYDWALATPAEISLKMSILSAFYFPQDKYTDLEDKTLSPVNTFRIIFNKFLNGRLALLENRYFLGNMTYPYNMLEVKK